MNSLLILIFAICIINTCSTPCQDSDLLYIINRGTGYFLGVDVNNTLILNYNYQEWCLNDESRSFYTPFKNPDKNTDRTGIVFYNTDGEKVIEVKDGVLSNAVLDLIPRDQAGCHEAEWQISYINESGMYSIKTVLQNSQNLALAAVSYTPTDGVTLKPYNPADVLQQWILQR